MNDTPRSRIQQFFDPPPTGMPVQWRMFWVALLARLLFMTIAHTYRMRDIQDHFQFGWEMGRIARALATGYGFADPFNGHSGPTAWTPPLYPLLMAGVFKVFGVYTRTSAWVILAFNCVFSAAVAPAVYEMGWRVFPRERGLKVALWSGWLWALYPAAMQYSVHWIWEMSLTVSLFAWALVLALRVRNIGEDSATGSRQTVRFWTIFGLLWGTIALSNSALLTFLPFSALWMLWSEARDHAGRALRNAVISGICFLAVVSPWVVRNEHALHAFVPMRSNFGAELFESVRPSNQGFPWGASIPFAQRDPVFQHYKQIGEVAFSKERGAQAMLIIQANPEVFVANFFKRIYFFWISVPHPVDHHPATEVIRELNFAFISLGGLLGLALALRRGLPGAWLFFWALFIIPFTYYFITVQARFRHPLEPILTVFIVYLFQSAEPARRKLA